LVTRYCGRLPPGRRGLKLVEEAAEAEGAASPSSRKAWIETLGGGQETRRLPSPSSRKAWIETSCTRAVSGRAKRRLPPGRRGLKRPCRLTESVGQVSPSSRKAWIETTVA